jgi:hypothetical protein
LYGGNSLNINKLSSINYDFLNACISNGNWKNIREDDENLFVYKKDNDCLVYYTNESDVLTSSSIRYKIYIGGINEFKRNGLGTITYIDKNHGNKKGFKKVKVITGKWNDDQLCGGKETIIIDDNGEYSGSINKNGKHGEGTMVYKPYIGNNDIFNGPWENNIEIQGWGKIHIRNDGEYYIGGLIGHVIDGPLAKRMV